jgi:hypothetical protein
MGYPENPYRSIFRERLKRWATKLDAGKKVSARHGPDLVHFMGTLMSFKSLSETSIANATFGQNWER